MSISSGHTRCLPTQAGCLAPRSVAAHGWWPQHREVSLNWVALGLLLAAWNSADSDGNGLPRQIPRRPEALRGYAAVSVRAATLHAAELRSLRPQR